MQHLPWGGDFPSISYARKFLHKPWCKFSMISYWNIENPASTTDKSFVCMFCFQINQKHTLHMSNAFLLVLTLAWIPRHFGFLISNFKTGRFWKSSYWWVVNNPQNWQFHNNGWAVWAFLLSPCRLVARKQENQVDLAAECLGFILVLSPSSVFLGLTWPVHKAKGRRPATCRLAAQPAAPCCCWNQPPGSKSP